MITLHRYMPAWDALDLSPFCMKVETYLRMVGLPFELQTADVRKAPKKKLPYVTDGTAAICDSRDIIAHFEAKLPNALDGDLSRADKALSQAYRGLIEEEMYFYVATLRWQTDEGWAIYRPVLREYLRRVGVPSPLTAPVAPLVRRQVIAAVAAQGSGRHSREALEQRALQAAEAMVEQLGDGPFFLGDKPRTIDATVYAFIGALLDTPFQIQARGYLAAQDAVGQYRARIRQAYFRPAAAV